MAGVAVLWLEAAGAPRANRVLEHSGQGPLSAAVRPGLPAPPILAEARPGQEPSLRSHHLEVAVGAEPAQPA